MTQVGGTPVVLVTGTTSGGMGRHVAMLASGLAAIGRPVTVYAPLTALPALTAGSPLPEAVSFGPIDLGGRPRLSDARTAARLRRLLRAGADGGPPGVVHAHGLRAGALCVLATVMASKPRPVVVTVHNAPPLGSGRNSLAYRVLEAIVARGADLVLCVSPDLEQRMRRAGARHVARAVIPAPRATPVMHTSKAASAPAATGRPVVLAVGRLAPQKGFATLLEAAASWSDMDPVPRLLIAGEGPLLPELRAQAGELGVEAEFLGHRDDVPALLAACDVFVLPSRWEGQPLVLQEALRAGAAIVATKAGGIADLAGPEAACLVAPDDVAALSAGVRAVLTGYSLAARLRAAALRRVESLPTEQDAITAVQEAYATAAKNSRSEIPPR
jgi:glycosyltransferase involved in cell wall biosynthesis